MAGRAILAGLVILVTFAAANGLMSSDVKAAGRGQPTDWQRFYYYPYVYYPQNFQQQHGNSFDHLYHRYPPDRRIPVYNEHWHNFYPTERPYHRGHHFILDVF